MARRPSSTLDVVAARPTRRSLLDSAAEAFNSDGYFGTDTNKIARAAGFAPQTFYRHFTDKMDIFLAVYEGWQSSERDAVAKAAKTRSVDRNVAQALLAHHRHWRVFRRSLRMLAIENEQARVARAFSRERQLADLARIGRNAGRRKAELLAAVLTVERLCDAAADGELEDMGLDDAQVLRLVVEAVRRTRSRP